MDLGSLTLIVTDDCNFNCSYCPQIKEKNTISNAVIEKTGDFFYPFFNPDKTNVNFYGGEPLLAFEQIKHAVLYLEEKNKTKKKKINYTMTINGSLLDDAILRFLDRYRFQILLSFDGFAHDSARQGGSFEEMVKVIKGMNAYPGIQCNTNSVFTPETVDEMAGSLQFILDLGVKEPRFALDTVQMWDDDALERLKIQLAELKEFLTEYHREHGVIPIADFKPETPGKGVFACFAARDRLAVSPDGNVWGCFLFHDFFKDKTGTREYDKYFLGELGEFIKNHETIMAEKLSHYKDLHQRGFYTEKKLCLACEEVESCKVCPVNAAMSGSPLLGKIPPWQCKINKLLREARLPASGGQGAFLKNRPLDPQKTFT